MKSDKRKLLGKYAVKLLYKWNNFEKEYLRKLERSWRYWKGD